MHDPSVNAACICRTTLARDLYTIFSWDLDLVLNKLTGNIPVDSIMNLASTGTGIPYIYRIWRIAYSCTLRVRVVGFTVYGIPYFVYRYSIPYVVHN